MADFFYNQKEILFKVIRRYIKGNHAKSLLDIGAGDGALALRLAKLVPTYIAVEKNRRFVQKLRRAGLTTLSGTFPIKLDGRFDIVLISHAVPERKKLYKRFLEEAWGRVKRGGILLVITFKGSNTGTTKIRKIIGRGVSKVDGEMYEEMMICLKRLGKVRIEKAISTMRSNNIEQMMTVISPLINVGKEARGGKYMPELKKILETRFKDSRGYYVPMEHTVISILKQK